MASHEYSDIGFILFCKMKSYVFLRLSFESDRAIILLYLELILRSGKSKLHLDGRFVQKSRDQLL